MDRGEGLFALFLGMSVLWAALLARVVLDSFGPFAAVLVP